MRSNLKSEYESNRPTCKKEQAHLEVDILP